MSDQGNLFDQPPEPEPEDEGERGQDKSSSPGYRARVSDPETSHTWAKKMNLESRDKWLRMLRALLERGPMTYSEVTDATGIRGTFTSTTLTRMERLGLVQRLVDDDGRELKRNGAMLRELTPAGRAVVT